MAGRNKPDMEVVFAQTGTKSNPGDIKMAEGWEVEKPPYEYMNFIQNRIDQFAAHINDWGLPTWDSASTYPEGAWQRGSNGTVYVSLEDDNQSNDPTVSPTKWQDFHAFIAAALIVGGVSGNIVTIGAGGSVVDSGTSLSEILADLSPQGNWDADTNTPDITTTTDEGHYWIVSVAGNTDLGGITDWGVNDWAIKTATGWAKIDNSSAFTADEIAAIQGANSPSAANVFLTENDAVSGGLNVNNLLHLRHEEANGVGGGTPTAGVFNARSMTVKTNTIAGASVAGPIITLPAGTYRAKFWAVAGDIVGTASQDHQARLYDTDNTTELVLGGSKVVNPDAAAGSMTDSIGEDGFILIAETDMQFDHYASLANVNGLGEPVSSGSGEVYADLEIWKVS